MIRGLFGIQVIVNSLVDKLVEECISVIDENKFYNETLNVIPSNDCASCTVYVVLFAVFLTSVIIGGVFYYFYWRSKKENSVNGIRFNPNTTHKLIN